MSRWDALLAVQEHDTTADQIEHRKRNLPARKDLDAAMADVVKVEARAVEVEASKPYGECTSILAGPVSKRLSSANAATAA